MLAPKPGFSTGADRAGVVAVVIGQVLTMAWTYMLECADGSFYVGSTVDLERRLAQHHAGEGAAYTRRRGRRPLRLVWAAQFERVDDAFLFEKRVQGLGRSKRIALIEGRYDDLPDLASRPRRRP